MVYKHIGKNAVYFWTFIGTVRGIFINQNFIIEIKIRIVFTINYKMFLMKLI